MKIYDIINLSRRIPQIGDRVKVNGGTHKYSHCQDYIGEIVEYFQYKNKSFYGVFLENKPNTKIYLLDHQITLLSITP